MIIYYILKLNIAYYLRLKTPKAFVLLYSFNKASDIFISKALHKAAR